MLLNYLLHHFYLSALIISALYISDYFLTIRFSELYQKGAKEFFEIEGGVELNPVYRNDINKLKKFNPKFFIILIGLNLVYCLFWYSSVIINKITNPFEFILGSFVLMEFFIHTRHIKNYYQAKATFKSGNLEGHIKYFRPFIHKSAAIDAIVFALFYFILWLLVGHQFFLGGALVCFFLALTQKSWLKKYFKNEKN